MGVGPSGDLGPDTQASSCPHSAVHGVGGSHARSKSAGAGHPSTPTGSPVADDSVPSGGCLWMRAMLQHEHQVHPAQVTETLKYSVTPPPNCPAHKHLQAKNAATGGKLEGHEGSATNAGRGSHSSHNTGGASANAGHKKNMSVSVAKMSSAVSPTSPFAVASPTYPMASSQLSPQSHLPVPSPASPPFLGRPVPILSASKNRQGLAVSPLINGASGGAGMSINLNASRLGDSSPLMESSSPPGTVNADTEWYGQAMILDSSDALWNAWMSTESWLPPPWFVRGAVVSEADEALVQESIAALHTGTPYREALRKENLKRRIAHDRALARGLPPPVMPDFDPITFLSFHYYEGLFFTLPALRRQFKSPIEVQGKTMVHTLVHVLARFATESRNNPGSEQHQMFTKQFKELCRRHIGYKVKMNQYNMVGEALFHSLQYCIGEAWTPAMCSAWVRLYSWVVQHIFNVMEQLAEEGEDEVTRSAARAAMVPPLSSSVLGVSPRTRGRAFSAGSDVSNGSAH